MAAVDTFTNVAIDGAGAANHAFLVTPDDANDLAFVTRAIRISAAGAVKLTTVGGETLIYPSGALAVGIAHAIRATRIWATSTTATGIVGEY